MKQLILINYITYLVENVIDLAMILANMEIRKQEKQKYKKLTGEESQINLPYLYKNMPSSLFNSNLSSQVTKDAMRQELTSLMSTLRQPLSTTTS